MQLPGIAVFVSILAAKLTVYLDIMLVGDCYFFYSGKVCVVYLIVFLSATHSTCLYADVMRQISTAY